MVTGIIGRKVGMTQIFDPDGTVHPATVIKAGPCVVLQAKTVQGEGYQAVQLGLVEGTPAKVGKPLVVGLPLLALLLALVGYLATDWAWRLYVRCAWQRRLRRRALRAGQP